MCDVSHCFYVDLYKLKSSLNQSFWRSFPEFFEISCDNVSRIQERFPEVICVVGQLTNLTHS
jgi:hypothetical protein